MSKKHLLRSPLSVNKLYLKTKPEGFFSLLLVSFEEKVQSVRLRRFHSKANTHTVYSVTLYKPTFTTISLKKKSLMWNFMLCKTNEYITGCFQLSFDSFEVSVNISSMNNKFAASKSEICVIHRQRSFKKKCLSYVFFLLLLLLSLVSTGALQYLIMMKRYNNNDNNHLPHVCRCAFIFGDYHLPIKREKK